jgi:hypothetical protein
VRHKRAAPGRRLAAAAAGILLGAAAALFCAGMLMVDYNSRVTGWGGAPTELAVSAQGGSVNVTLMGSSASLDISALAAARDVLGRVGDGLYLITPAPARLMGMVWTQAYPPARGAAERALERIRSAMG